MSALRRSRLRDLTPRECWSLLRAHEYGVGRVAIGGDVPVILPVNYLIDGGDVVLQTGAGQILHAAQAAAWLAFEIDSIGQPYVEEDAEVWSVLVKGPSRVVEDPAERTFLRLAHLDPQAGGLRPDFVAIAVRELTGRRRR